MNSALLRHPIEIYNVPIITSDYGPHKEGTPELMCRTKAHVIFNSENRTVSEGEVYYDLSRTFVVRHYIPVKEKNIIKYKDDFYRIISVQDNLYYNNKECICERINQ